MVSEAHFWNNRSKSSSYEDNTQAKKFLKLVLWKLYLLMHINKAFFVYVSSFKKISALKKSILLYHLFLKWFSVYTMCTLYTFFQTIFKSIKIQVNILYFQTMYLTVFIFYGQSFHWRLKAVWLQETLLYLALQVSLQTSEYSTFLQ